MKTTQKIAVLILLSIFSAGIKIHAQDMKMSTDHIMVMPSDVKWMDAPPSLPPGAKIAVLEGDPKAAGLFTMRLKLPANYIIMPHWHPADEHVTVIKGTFFMGLAEKFDKKTAKEIPTGGFAVMMMGTKHFAFTKEETIVQVHGMGPWGITYVNPTDDPRNKK